MEMAGEVLKETKQVLFLWWSPLTFYPPPLITFNTQLLCVPWCCGRHPPVCFRNTIGDHCSLVHVSRINLGEGISVVSVHIILFILITVPQCVCRQVHATLQPACPLGSCVRDSGNNYISVLFPR